jgi:hypothetical protein
VFQNYSQNKSKSTMATTRLRRTFHYPSDSNDPPDLDEEHQETLLQDLETTDQETSTLYRKLFLALPVLTTLHSILNPNIGHNRLGRSPATATGLFLTLLQIAVPALAGWILYYHPITVPDGRDGLMSSLYAFFSGKKSTTQSGNVKGPNAKHLIILGLSLSGMLVIMAGAKWSSMSMGFPETPEGKAGLRRINGEYSEIANLLLPAGMFAFVDFASKSPSLTGRQSFSSSRFSFASN